MSQCKYYFPHSIISIPIYIKCIQIIRNQQIQEIGSLGKIDSECSEYFWFVYFYSESYCRNQSQNDINVIIQITFIISELTSFNLKKKKNLIVHFLKAQTIQEIKFPRKPEVYRLWESIGSDFTMVDSCLRLFFDTQIDISFLFYVLSLTNFFPVQTFMPVLSQEIFQRAKK